MSNRARVCTVVAALAAVVGLQAAEKKIQMKDLPAAVQKAVQAEEAKGAKIVGLAKETENGTTTYEVETTMNGKSRDLLMDATGKIVETEEVVPIDSVPAPVKAGFESRGKVVKVETVTRGTTVTYEAVVEKSGKKSEVALNADGKPIKP